LAAIARNLRPALEIVGDVRARLGEGPGWDEAAGQLVWVDLIGRIVLFTDVSSGATFGKRAPEMIGCAVMTTRGEVVVAAESGFALLGDSEDELLPLGSLALADEMMMNDGKCDPCGRFLAGSMSKTGESGAGVLYALHTDMRCEPVLTGLTTPNGLCWSADGTSLFYIDSPRHCVEVFDYDLEHGRLSNRRTHIRFRTGDGLPDGMTIDEYGGLWVAFWGGGAVRRYDATGALDRCVFLPVTSPTSCAFGGPDLDRLFVTSSYEFLTAAQRSEQPLAGALFCLDVGIRGLRPPFRFAGRSRPESEAKYSRGSG